MESGVGSVDLVGVLGIGDITAVAVDAGSVGLVCTGVAGRQLARVMTHKMIAIALGIERRILILFPISFPMDISFEKNTLEFYLIEHR